MKLTTKLCATGATLATVLAVGLVPALPPPLPPQRRPVRRLPAGKPRGERLLHDQPGHPGCGYLCRLVHAHPASLTRTARWQSLGWSPAP